jgi:hypothetical protein
MSNGKSKSKGAGKAGSEPYDASHKLLALGLVAVGAIASAALYIALSKPETAGEHARQPVPPAAEIAAPGVSSGSPGQASSNSVPSPPEPGRQEVQAPKSGVEDIRHGPAPVVDNARLQRASRKEHRARAVPLDTVRAAAGGGYSPAARGGVPPVVEPVSEGADYAAGIIQQRKKVVESEIWLRTKPYH